MSNFGIRGDEVRRGQHIYLDAASQASVDAFSDDILSEAMLIQLNDGSTALEPTTAKTIAQKIKNSEGMIFALGLQTDQHYIGYAQISDIDWSARRGKLTISILDEAHFSGGMLRDSIQTVLQFIYWEANLNRIAVHAVEDHSELRDALDSLGFIQEGQLRQEAYRNGRYLDIVIYSILAREWSA